jgi:hypothetical protein
VYDRKELTLDFPKSALFFSPEGGEALPVDPKGARTDFQAVVAEWLQEVRHGVVRAGGQYVLAPTDGVLERVIRTLVHGGSLPVEVP